MKQNKLFKGDLTVSEVGLGAMSLMQGHDRTNTYILDKALELGVNYLDTSDLYDKGENEALLGRLIKSNRKEWKLASKVGNRWKDDGSGWDWVPSKDYIIKAVEGSLKRLNTDYLDLYQLHGGTIEDPFDEIVEAFDLLKQQGKILNYGISSIRPNVFIKYASASQMVSNMMQYSLLDRRPEAYFKQLEQYAVSVFARGTVAQGLMLTKAAQKYLSISIHDVVKIQKVLKETAKDLEVTTLAMALKYPLLHEPVVCSVLGIRSREQINDLADAIKDMNRLSLADYQPIMDLLPEVNYHDHLLP